MENKKDQRGDSRYSPSAENGRTPLGEAGDTLEKAVRDIPEIGVNPDYLHFSELETEGNEMQRLRRMYIEAERLLNAYSQ